MYKSIYKLIHPSKYFILLSNPFLVFNIYFSILYIFFSILYIFFSMCNMFSFVPGDAAEKTKTFVFSGTTNVCLSEYSSNGISSYSPCVTILHIHKLYGASSLPTFIPRLEQFCIEILGSSIEVRFLCFK